ncbi:MAG TPA: DUF2058 domain-containing protein [Steroidobacteraceae bacterium]|jgi:hypothetical protein|nr:DUF2058 domain-containing protein [Steroidobacteraceae bacterium]
MSTSLRDQLLQAGLVNQKQAKEAERQAQQQQQGQRHQLPKNKRGMASDPQLAAQRAQLAKAARDQELNRRQREQADKRARLAQIQQLIEQHRLPKPQTDESYHFVDGNRVRRIPADAATRARLGRGEIAIVRSAGRYELVPAETAARIRERDEHRVIACAAAEGPVTPDEDDGYRNFKVPDDLMW